MCVFVSRVGPDVCVFLRVGPDVCFVACLS